jgi:glycosyltransferase involved in cell wall biosynthesis
VVHHYGKLSESFIPDALEELERAGAEAWVGTLGVEGRATYPFPPDERLVVCPPPPLPRRALDRLRGRSGTERFAEALAARLRPVRPAVVHSQFGWSAATGIALARRLGVPAVTTFHGTDVTVLRPREAPEFNGLDTAIAVSEFISGRLRELGYEGPVEIVPAGVRLDRLPYRGAEPEPSPLRLVYVGRLNEQKGLDVLLRAHARLPDGVVLDVLGGGPRADDFAALAEQLGIAARVDFLGPLPRREDVLDALRRAHVAVMPSRAMPDGAAEGSPVVTKEAQAVGVPLVATDTGGIAETVPPEHRPGLVPGDDPEAMATAIGRLLDDPAVRAARATRARAWVEEQFDARRLAERTVALYRRLARD